MHLCQDEAQKFLRYDQVFVWRFDSAESIVAIFKNKLKGCWRNMDSQFDLLELCVIAENKILHLG